MIKEKVIVFFILVFLLEVVPDNNQQKPQVEHQAEILGYIRKNRIKRFQVRDEEHNQTDYERYDTELPFCCLIHECTLL